MKLFLLLVTALLLLIQIATAQVTPQLELSFEAQNLLARKETAAALRKLPANYSSSEMLAMLGDIDGARKIWSRITSGYAETPLNNAISAYAARKALKDGDLDLAEREIRSVKDQFELAPLWLDLSRGYNRRKRISDARRTAFYALKLVKDNKLGLYWPDVAVQLCELNENAAARRWFTIAEKELLNPDSLFGEPQDIVIEAAARCGFDDIAFKVKGSFPFQAIEIWARQDKDEVARRYIEHAVKEALKSFDKPAEGASEGQLTRKEIETGARLLCLKYLMMGQFDRGAIFVAGETGQEIDALLDANPSQSEWFELRDQNLYFYEANALWEMADKAIPVIKTYIQKYDEGTPFDLKERNTTSFQQRESFSRSQLGGLKVILQPEKYSLEQRQSAYSRFEPRLLQYMKDDPQSKPDLMLDLAQAQRNIQNPAWRKSLEEAQRLSSEIIEPKDRMLALGAVGEEWRKAGNIMKTREIGTQLLGLWRQFSARMKPVDRVSGTPIQYLLMKCGLFNEATQLLIPQGSMAGDSWDNALVELARTWNAPPPKKLLALPLKQRQRALFAWARGLAPDEPDSSVLLESDSPSRNFFN